MKMHYNQFLQAVFAAAKGGLGVSSVRLCDIRPECWSKCKTKSRFYRKNLVRGLAVSED